MKKDKGYNLVEKEVEEMLKLFKSVSYEKAKFRNVLPITKLDDIKDPEIEGMIKRYQVPLFFEIDERPASDCILGIEIICRKIQKQRD